MKIALINPPYLVIYRELKIKQDASLPLGLLYVAAMFEKDSHQVRVFDPNLHNTPLISLVKEVQDFNPDVVGITTVTATFNAAQVIAKALKKEFSKITIIMGGPHVSVLPKESLNITPAVDFVIVGEGELTVSELAKALDKKSYDFSSIAGLCYRDNGSIVLTKPREKIRNLDSIPYPAYHLLPVAEYVPSVVYHIKESNIYIASSRGCPATCTFCANEVTGRKLRNYSIDYVINLIHYVIDKYQICHFHVVDDNFMADQERVMEFCRRVIEKKLNITWFIFARTDHCQDIEVLKMIKKAGCVYIQFGIESGNVDILKQLGKDVTKEAMYKACMNCKKVGIDYLNSFMIGNPKDTKETVYETIDFAIKLDSIMAGFNILVPYPGTAIFKKYYQKDFKDNNDWSKWNHITHDVPIDYRHTPLSKQEIDQLRKTAIRKYYLRPRQVFRIIAFFRSFSLFITFMKSSWEHLFFLFSKKKLKKRKA